MFSSVSSFGLTGIACYPVTVEADVSRAFPCFESSACPMPPSRNPRIGCAPP